MVGEFIFHALSPLWIKFLVLSLPSVPRCFFLTWISSVIKISDSFEKLKDVALRDLAVNLRSSRLQELTEFALHVENNRESDQKLCIGKQLFRQYLVCLDH